jgi:hypothetical protein
VDDVLGAVSLRQSAASLDGLALRREMTRSPVAFDFDIPTPSAGNDMNVVLHQFSPFLPISFAAV